MEEVWEERGAEQETGQSRWNGQLGVVHSEKMILLASRADPNEIRPTWRGSSFHLANGTRSDRQKADDLHVTTGFMERGGRGALCAARLTGAR